MGMPKFKNKTQDTIDTGDFRSILDKEVGVSQDLPFLLYILNI